MEHRVKDFEFYLCPKPTALSDLTWLKRLGFRGFNGMGLKQS